MSSKWEEKKIYMKKNWMGEWINDNDILDILWLDMQVIIFHYTY